MNLSINENNMNNDTIHDNNHIPELQSPFEQLREVDAYGKEWWKSRKLIIAIVNAK